jgi:Domain of unknown function (DUF4159)
MCDDCHFRKPLGETRRSFLWKLAGGAVASAGLLGGSRAVAQMAAPAGRASPWARLVTPDPQWQVHRLQDIQLTDFIRRTTPVEIPLQPLVVGPQSVQLLAGSPFLFSTNLAGINDPRQLGQIREYLGGGGFVYIDGCITTTASFQDFHERHLKLFDILLEGVQVRRLAANHPIFHTQFPIEERQLPTQPPGDPRWKGAAEALYGVYDDDRMVMLLSQLHLQCGWRDNPAKQERKMRQIANIYVYAMTH